MFKGVEGSQDKTLKRRLPDNIYLYLFFSGRTWKEFGRGIPLWTRLDFRGGGGGEGSPYNCLYGEVPPERGTFFTRQIYKRVGISLVSSQAIKRVGPRGGASPIKLC